MPDFDSLSVDEIRKRLHAQNETTYDVPPELLGANSRQAAVLIPFLRIEDNWHILYIRRTRFEGDRHSGQVAFAGGKRDPEDADLATTALREVREEIGISPADINLLGSINHHHTISEFQVTPYVAELRWPCPLKLNDVEVARAFTLPLCWLADDRNYREEERLHPDSNRPWPVVYYDYYEGELLWGATARMTLSLIQVLREK
ncbi:MAG: CoA pyrophosphatase [Gammaproteobacteria bacterium]|nr:CoA pyrophosphatase [Gammaproteobacteria bacterium]